MKTTLDGNAKPVIDGKCEPNKTQEPLPIIELDEFPRLLVITSQTEARQLRAQLPELEIAAANGIEAHVCGPQTAALLQHEIGAERIPPDGVSIDSPSQAKWVSMQVERAAAKMLALLDIAVTDLTKKHGRNALPELSDAGLCEQWRVIRTAARESGCWPIGKPLTEAEKKPVEFQQQIWLAIKDGSNKIVGLGSNEATMRTAWEIKGYSVVPANIRGTYIPPEVYPYIKAPF